MSVLILFFLFSTISAINVHKIKPSDLTIQPVRPPHLPAPVNSQTFINREPLPPKVYQTVFAVDSQTFMNPEPTPPNVDQTVFAIDSHAEPTPANVDQTVDSQIPLNSVPDNPDSYPTDVPVNSQFLTLPDTSATTAHNRKSSAFRVESKTFYKNANEPIPSLPSPSPPGIDYQLSHVVPKPSC
ncbi:hypothetical protein RND81_02G034800 [Saponaria officinalis]|uniref:Uncharacterized protein n=1 Tax=Saponaria officinalis TaxID=3572 RepID=A0AAW1MRF5_SAPOF